MGNVYGIPGGSVSEPGAVTWAANSAVAQIGGAAERRTGELLNRLAESSEWDVFHDLRVQGLGRTSTMCWLVHVRWS